MWAGCYSLDLYCDNQGCAKEYRTDTAGCLVDKHGHTWGEFPHQYTGEFGADCKRRARKAGWVIKPGGVALCPKCSGKANTSSNQDYFNNLGKTEVKPCYRK